MGLLLVVGHLLRCDCCLFFPAELLRIAVAAADRACTGTRKAADAARGIPAGRSKSAQVIRMEKSMSDDVCLSMKIPPDTAFACPVVHAAKTLAGRMGIGERENFRFQLTVEEFCLCLIGLARTDNVLCFGAPIIGMLPYSDGS